MARIIEAKAVISGEEKLSPLLDKLAKKFDQVQKSARTAGDVDKMAASIARVNTQMKAIEKFNAAKIGFVGARANFRQAQEAVDKAAKAMKSAEAPTRQLETAYRRAQAAVTSASRAFEMQKTSVLGAKRALEQHGIPINSAVAHQAKLAAAVDRTNAALQRQQRWAARRKVAGGVGQAIGTMGGLAAGSKAKSFGIAAVDAVKDFDLGVREQRVFTDINASQQKVLVDQAKRIGQETQFTNLDVVKAQTATMQGLPTN